MFSVGEIAAIVLGELMNGGEETPRRIVHDSRDVQAGDLFVALPGTRTDGHAFLEEAFRRGACSAILSDRGRAPASARGLILVPDPLAALQKLAGAWRDQQTAKIVAITGSNGKTTTRSLLAHLLQWGRSVHEAPANYNTEIGLPLALLGMPDSAEVGVFELGTEHPGEIGLLAKILRPTIAILTGVGPSHLDGFGSLDAIAKEKWSLVDGLPSDGVVLVNSDSEPIRPCIDADQQRADGTPFDLVTVGLSSGGFRGRVIEAVPRLLIEVNEPRLRLETSLLGRHNAANVLLAAAAAHRLGLPPHVIEERAKTFEPIPHRLRPLSAPFGTVLDDTYNANPASMKAALDVLAGFGPPSARRGFVFGDMLGLGSASARHHLEILDLAFDSGIDFIVPVGEHASAACLSRSSSQVLFAEPEELPVRVRERLTGPEDVLLIKGSRALALERLVDELLSRG
ncbi:MAG: UDP-N-acetylmuramoyl-tripeptide--D-alanyl-D-alanine ligase [Candidatus Bipolaricaulia bacterium]